MNDKENFDERLANKFRKELEDYEVEYNPEDWEKLRPRLKPSVFINIWKNEAWKPLSMAVAAALSLLIVAYAYWNMTSTTPRSEEQNIVLKEGKTTENQPADTAASTLAELYKAQSEKIDALSKNSQNKGLNHDISEKKSPPEIHARDKVASNYRSNQLSKTLDQSDGRLAQQARKNSIEKKQAQVIVKHKVKENEIQEKEETPAKHSLTSEEKRTVLVQFIELDSTHFKHAPPIYAKNLDLELKNITSLASAEHLPAKMALGLVLNTLTYQNTIENTSSWEMGLQIDLPVSRKLHLITSILIAQQQMEFNRERSVVKETTPPTTNNVITSANPPPTHRNIFITQHAHGELTILNLPIDLQYDLIESGKWKIFLRGGISNYAYIVEKYKFVRNMSSISTDFTLLTEPQYTNYYTFTERKHRSFSQIDFFAGLNFGAGIQYAAGRHLLVQAVPFYRLPVRRVAHENIEFNTYGLSLIVGYK